MSLAEIFIIAVSLAMDALAVSASNGLALKNAKIKHACLFGLYFGVFQCIMPIIGFFCGIGFGRYIEMVDHWIAFGLLSLIGGKMIYDSRQTDDDGPREMDEKKITSPKNMIILAIATSIDALAVGVSFALTDNVNIWLSAAIIGIVAYALSFVGVLAGKQIGGKFEKHAALIGGIVLIIIGLRILITDLFF